jgi:hypothetical protein
LKDDYSAFIFSLLGDIEVDLNQFEKAINLYHLGLKIAKKYNNQEYMASFKCLIGTAYLNLFKTPNKNDFATQNHFRNTPLSRVPKKALANINQTSANPPVFYKYRRLP